MSKLCLNHRVSLFFSLGGGGSWLTDQSIVLPVQYLPLSDMFELDLS